MDYGRLVNRAFQIAWRYKTLWIFGLFAGGSSNFNLDLPFDAPQSFDPQAIDLGNMDLRSFITEVWGIPMEYIYALLVAAAVFIVVLIAAKLIAVPALIDAANKIERGGQYRFSTSFSTGLDFFFRFLGLWLIWFLVTLVYIGGIIGVEIILFYASTVLGIISLLFAIPLFLFGCFAIYNIFSIAQRAMVVRNAAISDGIHEGWLLFWRNLGKMFIILLIWIGLTIALMIVLTIAFVIFGIPLAAIAITSESSAVMVLILGILIGLPASLVLGGFFGAFFEVFYTLFYFELVEPTSTKLAEASLRPNDPGISGSPA